MSATLCLCAGAPFILGKVLTTSNLAHDVKNLMNAMIWLWDDL